MAAPTSHPSIGCGLPAAGGGRRKRSRSPAPTAWPSCAGCAASARTGRRRDIARWMPAGCAACCAGSSASMPAPPATRSRMAASGDRPGAGCSSPAPTPASARPWCRPGWSGPGGRNTGSRARPGSTRSRATPTRWRACRDAGPAACIRRRWSWVPPCRRKTPPPPRRPASMRGFWRCRRRWLRTIRRWWWREPAACWFRSMPARSPRR